jgi:hypothetical protein
MKGFEAFILLNFLSSHLLNFFLFPWTREASTKAFSKGSHGLQLKKILMQTITAFGL